MNIRFLFMVLTLNVVLTAQQLHAQQAEFGWKVLLSGGAVNYHGELSERILDIREARPGFAVELERTISPSFAFRVGGYWGQLQSNDRKTNWNGDLIMDAANFDRALNFRTELRSWQAVVVWYSDNGHLLSSRACLSPYAFAGIGWSSFDVRGDLVYGELQRYFYWSDGTIRDGREGRGEAGIIEQDGKFETALQPRVTEAGGPYDRSTFSIPFGLGLKFKLSRTVNLSLESRWNYTFTDYLDDVGGAPVNPQLQTQRERYPADPAGTIGDGIRGDARGNDFFTYSSLRLEIAFGRKRSSFRAPVFTPSHRQVSGPPPDFNPVSPAPDSSVDTATGMHSLPVDFTQQLSEPTTLQAVEQIAPDQIDSLLKAADSILVELKAIRQLLEGAGAADLLSATADTPAVPVDTLEVPAVSASVPVDTLAESADVLDEPAVANDSMSIPDSLELRSAVPTTAPAVAVPEAAAPDAVPQNADTPVPAVDSKAPEAEAIDPTAPEPAAASEKAAERTDTLSAPPR